jgi:nicotinamidase-related amidase
MEANTYNKNETALLFIDPYNDFLSEGGKVWPMLKEVAEDVNLLDNLRTIVTVARKAGIRIFIVPHRRVAS